eukprot:834082-Alexandrium_andersonii.AAC.1
MSVTAVASRSPLPALPSRRCASCADAHASLLRAVSRSAQQPVPGAERKRQHGLIMVARCTLSRHCLLYTSDAADDM